VDKTKTFEWTRIFCNFWGVRKRRLLKTQKCGRFVREGFSKEHVNPFTPSSGQSKNSRKITIFSFSNPAKQIVPCNSTVKEISFEWSQHGILSTDSKFRTSLRLDN